MLDLYAMKHNSTDLTLMLHDYVLDNRLNRDELNAKIILELGERFPYWNHTDLMKANIDNWFATNELNIKKLTDTLFYEYNPLHTSDYTESTYEHRVNDDTVREDLSRVEDKDKATHDTTSEDLSNVEVKSKDEDLRKDEDLSRTEDLSSRNSGTVSDSSSTNTVSAYNANDYQPQDKNETLNTTDVTTTGDNAITEDNTITEDNNITEHNSIVQDNTITVNGTETNDNSITEDNTIKTDKDEVVTIDHRHVGKEGTDSYASLIEAERRLAIFNIYDWIVNQLDSEICLGVFF